MLRILLSLTTLIITLTCNSQVIDSLKLKGENNQNPEKWDQELFDYDKARLKNDTSKPLTWVAYPVEEYEMGVFSKPFNFRIEDFTFSGIAFGENLSSDSGGFSFDYYASLIFYTREPLEIQASVISRNAPSVTIQGQLKLDEVYDFIGVKHPDESGTLFVGVKSFDLRFGSTIVVLPDGNDSFVYLQLTELPESDKDFDDYLARLKDNTKIRNIIKYVNSGGMSKN